jgi:integrase
MSATRSHSGDASTGATALAEDGRRHFEALRDRAKLRRVRFHDLRHSCASLLFELGVPLRMVMEILGHSQISTTSDIYTHVMPAQYREVADALDAWLGDGQGGEDDGR